MQFLPGKAHAVPFQANTVRRFAEEHQEDEGIDGKRKDCRPDDTEETEIKDRDREQVQDDIHNIGDNQTVQGRLRKIAASKL